MRLDTTVIEEHRDQTFRRLRSEEDLGGDEQGRVSLMGERFNIMGADYFMASILEMLSELYGQGAGGILRETGESYGDDLLALCEHDGEGDAFSQCFGQFLGALAFLGYSKPEVEEDGVRFPSSPTAEEYR
ncbi:MAG: hypothetical protein SVU32_05610, partial [Candidatus Nanohaloarchaea archaeon]|nr:hypothetical protein [Candidatus Nanohaloarchaea archaeon]